MVLPAEHDPGLAGAAERLLGACHRVRAVRVDLVPASEAGVGSALRCAFDVRTASAPIEQLLAQLNTVPGVMSA